MGLGLGFSDGRGARRRSVLYLHRHTKARSKLLRRGKLTAHLVLHRLVRRRPLLLYRSMQLAVIASSGLGTAAVVGRAAALLLASTAVAARGRGGRPEAVAWMCGG